MHRQWQLRSSNPEFVRYLAAGAGVPEPVAQILINRGLNTPEAAAAFLGRVPPEPADPQSMHGMGAAVEAIAAALADGLQVFIHGDYDADGVTSTSIMTTALRAIGFNPTYFIPNRFDHGYGFHPPAVDLALERGAGMILTVDCGVSSFEAAEYAAGKGLRVVITDHHEPTTDADGHAMRPRAEAVVNPKLDGQDAPLASLSGAGVAYLLACALASRFPGRFNPDALLDLAALGTIADSVPLTGENRRIVREGIALISAAGGRAGVAALKRAVGLVEGRPVRTSALAFKVVPRINAAGRVSDATEVVRLLLTESAAEAEEIVVSLGLANAERQRIEEEVLNEAIAMIEAGGLDEAPAIVVAGEGWHEGVVGIVASRIVDRFNRPAIVLAVSGDEARGSGRSVSEFDIYEGLCACHGVLEAYGGHRQAVGLSIKVSNIPEFTRIFGERAGVELARAHGVDGPEAVPTLTLDCAIQLRDVNFRLVEDLSALEPFGMGNPEPVLGTRGLGVVSARVVGNNHLKLRVREGSATMDCIGFKMGHMLDTINETLEVDAAYMVEVNEWEGRRNLQLVLKGLRPAEM